MGRFVYKGKLYHPSAYKRAQEKSVAPKPAMTQAQDDAEMKRHAEISKACRNLK